MNYYLVPQDPANEAAVWTTNGTLCAEVVRLTGVAADIVIMDVDITGERLPMIQVPKETYGKFLGKSAQEGPRTYRFVGYTQREGSPVVQRDAEVLVEKLELKPARINIKATLAGNGRLVQPAVKVAKRR